MQENVATLIVAAFCLAILRISQVSLKSKKTQLPPGPKPLPIVGNMFDMPTLQPWKRYSNWHGKYGDMVFLDLPFQPLLILGSLKACRDLLDKRSEIYSDRVPIIMDNLLGLDFNFAFMPYGQKWRASRKFFHQYFNASGSDIHIRTQVSETRRCLLRASQPSADIAKLTRLAVAATLVKVMYGKDVTDMNDDYIQMAAMTMEGLAKGHIPGAFWVEYLPILRHIPSWFPGARFKRLAETYKPYSEAVVNQPYETILEQMADATAPPCVAQTMILDLRKDDVSNEDRRRQESLFKEVLATTYAAGVDTTTALIHVVLIAMAKFPEVQRKAQSELDTYVGQTRLPNFGDLNNLHFIRAIIMEAMRWRPIAPFGVLHRLVREDQYNGYYIPRGTNVVPNAWEILNNSEDFPRPDQFLPERYLKDGKLDTNVCHPGDILFGFGRRVCPGRDFAESSVFIMLASILHAFNVEPAIGADGQPMNPDVEMSTGQLSVPESLHVAFKFRFADAENVICESVRYETET